MSSIFDSHVFNSRLFYPDPRVSPPGEGALDLWLNGHDDVRLHLRIHQRPESLAVVLLFHGNGEVVADYDSSASAFAAAGADLAVMDYRGYGSSQGSPTLRSCLLDAPAVLEAARAHAAGRPLIVMGRSLGGACAAELCQQVREGVSGYVFESAAADLLGLVRRRGLEPSGPIPNADLAVFDPLPKLRRCTTPALVLHGDADQIIALDEGRMILAALGSADKELVIIPDRGHNDVSYHPWYWEALARFIASVTSASK